MQSDDITRILRTERELAEGSGDVYRRHLGSDAVVIVPGAILNKAGTVASMDLSPAWDEFTMDEEDIRLLADRAALLSYRFEGRRGPTTYRAMMSSVYVREGSEGWQLVHHQQTPIEDAAS